MHFLGYDVLFSSGRLGGWRRRVEICGSWTGALPVLPMWVWAHTDKGPRRIVGVGLRVLRHAWFVMALPVKEVN